MKVFLIIGLLGLSACLGSEPYVSEFNGDSVEIQEESTLGASDPDDPAIVGQAQELCASRNRKAKYASTRAETNPVTYQSFTTHLFVCV